MKRNSMLATVVLASSIFAAAQVASPEAIAANPDPAAPATTAAFDPAPAPINPGTQSNTNQVKHEKNGNTRMAPDDPRKSPFQEPIDWNYLSSLGGGGN